MRSTGLIVLTALALLAAASPASAKGTVFAPCEGRNFGGSFEGAFTRPDRSLVVGPLALPFGNIHANTTQASIDRFGGDKFPVLLEPGHTASMLIVDAPPEVRFGTGMRELRVESCPKGTPRTNVADGREVTFWMTWLHVTRPSCIYIDITIDDGPVAHRVMSFGAGECAPPREDEIAETCASSVGADFRADLGDRRENIEVGALTIPGAGPRGAASPAARRFPVVLEDGHRARVRIVAAYRQTATGWQRLPRSDAGFGRDRAARARFEACRPTTADGAPNAPNATTWLPRWSVKDPACVYVDITVDRRGPVRRALPFGAGACPARVSG